MTDRAIRKGAGIAALALLLAGCDSREDAAKMLDEKVAAAERAAERAEKAQRLAEQAMLANVNNGGGGTYDEPAESRDLNDEDRNEDHLDEDQSPPRDDSGDASDDNVVSQGGGSSEVIVPRVVS